MPWLAYASTNSACARRASRLIAISSRRSWSPARSRRWPACCWPRRVARTRRFGGLAAVNGVSLDLHVGEVHAVIGTNGAGKSTLINLLSGELPTSSGRVELAGRDITRMPQPQRARLGVGRSYQRTTV